MSVTCQSVSQVEDGAHTMPLRIENDALVMRHGRVIEDSSYTPPLETTLARLRLGQSDSVFVMSKPRCRIDLIAKRRPEPIHGPESRERFEVSSQRGGGRCAGSASVLARAVAMAANASSRVATIRCCSAGRGKWTRCRFQLRLVERHSLELHIVLGALCANRMRAGTRTRIPSTAGLRRRRLVPQSPRFVNRSRPAKANLPSVSLKLTSSVSRVDRTGDRCRLCRRGIPCYRRRCCLRIQKVRD